MNVNLNKALHIVSGDSAARILKAALRIPKSRLIISEGPLAYGPAPATDDLLHWRSIREKFLQSIYLHRTDFRMDHYANNGLLSNASRLAEKTPVIAWVSSSLEEQLLLAWLTVLFENFERDHSQLLVGQIKRLSPSPSLPGSARFSAENVQQTLNAARVLTPLEIAEYQSAWRTYTSSDPIDLMRFLSRQTANEPLFAAMRHLVYRYPSVETGLSVFDENLLQNADRQGPEAARIIALTIETNNTFDAPGEDYLFYRLQKLSHPHRCRPLLRLSGNDRLMHSCLVEITAFGKEILEGRSEALEKDDINDWIGGVHLDKTKTIPFRIKDDLYWPM